MLRPAFSKARFESIRSIGDAMLDQEIEQILVKIVAERRVVLSCLAYFGQSSCLIGTVDLVFKSGGCEVVKR